MANSKAMDRSAKDTERKRLAAIVTANIRQCARDKWREKLSDAAIARRVKLAPNTLKYWERGTAAPRLDKLERVAKALGCHVWELVHPDLPGQQRIIRTYNAMAEVFRSSEAKL